MSGVRKARIAAVTCLLFFSGLLSTWAAVAGDQICNVNADFALGREDYATAIMLHRKVLQSQPNNALAHYHLGFAYGMVGRRSKELHEYLTSARLGLKDWDLFLNLGLAYLGERKLTQAAGALETAVSLGPEHAEAHFNLAIVYENENRFGEALREITAARRLAPENPYIANSNAIICVETGDLVSARNIWTDLAQVAPDYAPARVNLSILNSSQAYDQIAKHTGRSYSEAEISSGNAQTGSSVMFKLRPR